MTDAASVSDGLSLIFVCFLHFTVNVLRARASESNVLKLNSRLENNGTDPFILCVACATRIHPRRTRRMQMSRVFVGNGDDGDDDDEKRGYTIANNVRIDVTAIDGMSSI